MTTTEKTSLFKELALRFPKLASSELELGIRNSEKNGTSVGNEIEQHRAKFEKNRTANIGAASFATPEVWDSIREDSEAAARRELLASSVVFSELNELERKAAEAKRLADAKNAELNALYSEFSTIPERADAINEKLNSIANELAALDPVKLEADFRQLYRATLDGAIADPFARMQLVGLIVTAPLRKETLDSLSTELQGELAQLNARRKALARKLGQRI